METLACVKCGESEPEVLVRHHMVPTRLGGSTVPVLILCRNCHELLHRHISPLVKKGARREEKYREATEVFLGRPLPQDLLQEKPPSLGAPRARPIREEIYRRYVSGEDTQTLAREFGVGKQRIYNIISYLAESQGRPPPRRLTPEQHEEICQLYRDGYSTTYIAHRFARAPKTVLEILSRHGVDVQWGFMARKKRSG